MIRVRNIESGVIAPGYLELLKRAYNVDFLEVLDGEEVLTDEQVKDLIENFKTPRAQRAAKVAEQAQVEEEDAEPIETGDLTGQINAAATKDELEAIARENFGHEIDKRRKLETIREEVLKLAEG